VSDRRQPGRRDAPKTPECLREASGTENESSANGDRRVRNRTPRGVPSPDIRRPRGNTRGVAVGEPREDQTRYPGPGRADGDHPPRRVTIREPAGRQDRQQVGGLERPEDDAGRRAREPSLLDHQRQNPPVIHPHENRGERGDRRHGEDPTTLSHARRADTGGENTPADGDSPRLIATVELRCRALQ